MYVIDEFMNFILQVHVFDMTESKVLNMHCFIGLELKLCYCRFLIRREELISAVENCKKHMSLILNSRFYFSKRC